MRYIKQIKYKDLKNFGKYIKEITESIEKAKEDSLKEVSDEIMKEISENYTIYDNEEAPPAFFSRKTANNYQAGVQGSQVIYHEYGTGTEGERNSHPNKEGKGLNPYNSGKTIRENKDGNSVASMNGIPVGELYWTYKKMGIGKTYTQGHGAGKEVFNAVKKVRPNVKKIFSEKVGEELSKL